MAKNSICKRCRTLIDVNRDEKVVLEDDAIEVADRFPYLVDVLSSAGGVLDAVTARMIGLEEIQRDFRSAL